MSQTVWLSRNHICGFTELEITQILQLYCMITEKDVQVIMQRNFLTGFSGYLQCDGYSGYNKLENTKRVGCWAHVRRKFLEALESQADKTDFSTAAGQGFLYIEKLFSLEHTDPKKPLEFNKLSLEDISEIRETQSKKLLSEFFSWAESEFEKILPQSLVGKALNYAINQKSTLITFLENPKLELTNNLAERSIKPFVIGRKNWLFCNTLGGANSSAIVYSMIETAKENNLKPYDYLVWLFENIRSINSKSSGRKDWSRI